MSKYAFVFMFIAISPAVSSADRNLASISTCRASEFTCLDGTCISAGVVCDTYWNCPDGSDEVSCYSSTNSNLAEATVSHERYKRQSPCGLYQWRCTDGSCIAADGKCDGKTDCPDKSDETQALCGNIEPTVSEKCVLPPYPEHGTYVVTDYPSASPGQSLQFAQLNITCEQGYGVVGDDTVSFCLHGIWTKHIQNCVRDLTAFRNNSAFCRLDPDVSVSYYCQISGTEDYRLCNQSVPSGTLVKPECNAPVYGSTDVLLSMTCQSDGKWNRITKCKPAFCRLDPDVSVSYNCQISGTEDYRLCNQSVPSGTLVKPECNAPVYGSTDVLLSMTCQSDGKWNRITKCKPECGRVTPSAESLIRGGTEAIRGELPWHVAIYEKPTRRRNYYKQICGGSLVSNRIVISAAHCFGDTLDNEKPPASKYSVAAAKLFMQWDHKDDKDAQKSELKSIERPPRYLGGRANYQHDIAVLILKTPFKYYIYVRPVCLDLLDAKFNDRQLQEGNLGKVAGWGLTDENGPPSPVLKTVELPFVPIRECIRITPLTFTEIITGDKICAGYSNGTAAVCKGDSGGGLSFPETKRGITRYYLRGVVSTAPRVSKECNVFSVTAFTEIYQHKYFIKQIMSMKCTLPPYPEYGVYEVAGDPAAKPGDDAEKVYLYVSCNHGHSLVGSDVLQCTLGEWISSMPECVRACEWDGVEGKCVKETQCLTTLDTRGDKHLVCSKKGDVTIVCCTDCELVNDTRNVVMSPTTGFYWKDGTKARDSCLQYLKDLPYRCREGGSYSGISRNYNDEKKCHTIGLWGVGGAPPPGSKSGAEYPHQATLGYGSDLASANWIAGGSIVSNKFILTAASIINEFKQKDVSKFVALGVEKRSDSPTAWQTHDVKSFIPHPDYKASSLYNDIALVETETPITFNKNVLPACLNVEAANAETAIATTWIDLKSNSGTHIADEIQTIHLDELTEEECKTAYNPDRNLKEGINYNTQMCYGSKSHSPEACRGLSGEPLLISTQFSRCIYTIIGVTSFGKTDCGPNTSTPDVYTRVAHYKPWIESVVWA